MRDNNSPSIIHPLGEHGMTLVIHAYEELFGVDYLIAHTFNVKQLVCLVNAIIFIINKIMGFLICTPNYRLVPSFFVGYT